MKENRIGTFRHRAGSNRALDAAQVIDELIRIAKEMRLSESRGQEMWLSDDEVAFYDALAENASAKQAIGDEKLRFLMEVAVLVIVPMALCGAGYLLSVKNAVAQGTPQTPAPNRGVQMSLFVIGVLAALAVRSVPGHDPVPPAPAEQSPETSPVHWSTAPKTTGANVARNHTLSTPPLLDTL